MEVKKLHFSLHNLNALRFTSSEPAIEEGVVGKETWDGGTGRGLI